MTVHKSKGLEFPVVVLADLFWKEKGSLRRILFDDRGFIIVKESPGGRNEEETVPGRLLSREEQKSFEEEKRTLYVALSRARDMLLMSANGRGNATRPWSRMLGGTLLDIESANCCQRWKI
jgi:ATP-dependent exoDNAse (exonuclease V) beta subunit